MTATPPDNASELCDCEFGPGPVSAWCATCRAANPDYRYRFSSKWGEIVVTLRTAPYTCVPTGFDLECRVCGTVQHVDLPESPLNVATPGASS